MTFGGGSAGVGISETERDREAPVAVDTPRFAATAATAAFAAADFLPLALVTVALPDGVSRPDDPAALSFSPMAFAALDFATGRGLGLGLGFSCALSGTSGGRSCVSSAFSCIFSFSLAIG